MGIRLSYRKKGIESGEACLGKLFSYFERYAEANDCRCISYLIEIGALKNLFDDFECELYDTDYTDNEKFAFICDICQYQDYGEFFELTKSQAHKFIELYADDHAKFWGHAKWDMSEFYKFLDDYSSSDNGIFEFRLGA